MKKYEKYKDSRVEWIGEIPSHWKEVRIKQLAMGDGTLFLDGDWIESKEIVFDEDNIRYITTGNIGEGVYKEQGSGYITEETFKKLNCTEVFAGDLVISRLNPPIGRACIVPELGKRIVTAVDNVILRPSHEYSRNFLVHFFSNSKYHEFTLLEGRGATMQRVSRSILGNIKIVVPNNFEEQTAIATYLDRKTAEIDALIADKKRLLELYETEKTAIINQAVTKGIDPGVAMKDSGVAWLGEVPEGWEVKKLRHIKSSKKNAFVDGPFGSNLKTEHFIENGDVYVIDSGFVTSGRFEFTRDFKTISYSHFETVNRSECEENDIIIAKIGANFGMSGILPKLDKPSLVSGNTLKLTVNTNLYSTEFIHKQLLCLKWAGEIDLLVKGSAQPALSMGPMSDLSFAIPKTIEEQHRIVRHIEAESARIAAKQAKTEKLIALLTEYRTALVSEVVTGKVRVV